MASINKDIYHPLRALRDKLDEYFQKKFIIEKLYNWFGIAIFFTLAVVMGYLMASKTLIGLSVFGFTLGGAVVLTCLLNTEAGLFINMIFSFFAFFLSRLFFDAELKVGVISDILILATLFSFFIKKVNLQQRINEFSKTTVVTILLIVYAYLAILLFNPDAKSFDGWYQAFRKTLGTLLILFIAYNVFDSYEKIRRYLIVLFILCTITGLYGCFQQWFGLFDFEAAWVAADRTRFGLIFLGGDYRKFSTMSDPTAYGIVMGACSILFLIIASTEKRPIKWIVILGAVFMLLGMSYSGTRTANAMVVASLALFILLTINKKNTQVFAIVAGILFFGLLYGPFNNATINRFRTTFISGTDDASYKVRENSRKMIQPYIYTHPIGGGLGTTGSVGVETHPGHFLAGFQPDSGYLKKALEIGYIGLAIYCLLYFFILKTGIKYYFSSRIKENQIIYAGVTSAIFGFYMADFTQSAMGQITDIVVYYPFIAILLNLNKIERTNKI